ncbi:hypothetical protein CCACVL1_05846 [Corchorus capsularis]|uniref:Uncharacterized protein n=1 Tax=Corchorus capsularis TaxID=210143 RepID=A0A1R3JIS2_COCAP|nr:hypothetical protein CCACVL1_05846 [Corchorus capsularis]
METRRRRRLQISASESTTDIRIKFTRLVSRQEELKVAFNQLKSQIKIGLAEAEDVFASLAVPLMKLVGLKTEEMADEGRFTTIIVDNDLSPERSTSRITSDITYCRWRRMEQSDSQKDEVLCSVEDGMQGLMQDLTEQMCNPMVEYVKSLKADLKTGTCANLLAVVDEMECSTRNGRIELEDVRKRLRVAEEGRIKALCQLKETEGKLRRMKEYQEFLAEIQQGHMEHLVSRKRKMRSFRSPGSSMGPNDILFNGSNMKHHQSTKGRPSFSNRPVIVSHLQSSRIPSGLSPSCAIQQVNSRKCISPRLLNP